MLAFENGTRNIGIEIGIVNCNSQCTVSHIVHGIPTQFTVFPHSARYSHIVHGIPTQLTVFQYSARYSQTVHGIPT